jgi:hypothetical protein
MSFSIDMDTPGMEEMLRPKKIGCGTHNTKTCITQINRTISSEIMAQVLSGAERVR